MRVDKTWYSEVRKKKKQIATTTKNKHTQKNNTDVTTGTNTKRQPTRKQQKQQPQTGEDHVKSCNVYQFMAGKYLKMIINC